jgi:V8-like Glu-specific endopeptidase
MRFIWFTLGVVLCLPLAHASFTRLAKFKKNPPPGLEASVYERGESAVLGLVFNGDVSSSSSFESGAALGQNLCGATFISNDGYVLTALHCLENCSVEKTQTHGAITIMSSDLEAIKAGRVTCNVDPSTYNKSMFTVSSPIVAAGLGTITAINSKAMAESTQESQNLATLIAQGYTDSEDYAILKLPIANHGCLQVASPYPSENVWSISWPVETSRDGSDNAPGGQPVFTSGIITSILSTTPLKSAGQTQSSPRYDGNFMTTVDAVYGSSGSGILNSEGRLVGMTARVGLPADPKRRDILYFENPGLTHAISIDKIRSEMRKRYGAALVNEVFSCR